MPRYVVRCKHGTLVGWGQSTTEHAHVAPCPPHCEAAVTGSRPGGER